MPNTTPETVAITMQQFQIQASSVYHKENQYGLYNQWHGYQQYKNYSS